MNSVGRREPRPPLRADETPVDEEEMAFQRGPFHPHSPASLERARRLTTFVARTKDHVWIGGNSGYWQLVPAVLAHESIRSPGKMVLNRGVSTYLRKRLADGA